MAGPQEAYVSMDGGTEWEEVLSGLRGTTVIDVKYISLGHYVVASRSIIATVIDGEKYLSNVGLEPRALQIDLSFTSEHEGCFITGDGRLVKTLDGGKTWKVANPNVGNSHVSSIVFASSMSGWFTTNRGEIFATKDGGRNWVRIFESKNENIEFSDIELLGDSLWAVGSGVVVKGNRLGQFQEVFRSDLGTRFVDVSIESGRAIITDWFGKRYESQDVLSISHVGGEIRLDWDHILNKVQSSESLVNPNWIDFSDGGRRAVFEPSESQRRFFRLVRVENEEIGH